MKGMVKEASLVIQMTTMADYGTAYLVMYLVMAIQEIQLMRLLGGCDLGNFGQQGTGYLGWIVI